MNPAARPSDRVLKRLMGLHPRVIDLSLGRIERLLAALGHPERKLPPVIHVAGTNGKGSVVADLRAMAEAAGLRVHVYTSPHLVRFHERIRLAGRLIGEKALAASLEDCETANGGKPITYFEITTAAAFHAFAATPADIALIEVGLGGRLDATNVINRPRLSVITPISLDHQGFLGDRLDGIAHEKAGILKRAVPAVIGPQHAIAARVIAAVAKKTGAPLIRHGADFSARRDGDTLVYRDPDGITRFPAPALQGDHQTANAAIAIAAARAFDDRRIDDGAIGRGLAHADWPARLQRLAGGRLSAAMNRRGFEIWLDGGHNPQAGRALARVTAGWQQAEKRPLYIVCGMIRTKDPKGFLSPLLPGAAGLWTVPAPEEHAGIPAAELAEVAGRAGVRAHIAPGVAEALADIAHRRAGRVLVTGSLYLAGAVLAAEGPKAYPR